jgi:hypothetical protein
MVRDAAMPAWWYDVPEPGYNYRLTDMQAALGTSQLGKLERFVKERNRIADAYRATTVDTLQVGFKWIGQAIDQTGPEHFVFGCEESHGYLAGTHVRDKDASVAALLMAELTAELAAAGRTPHELLDELFCTHGCHLERQVSVMLPGASGMDRMREIMGTLRARPPRSRGGRDVVRHHAPPRRQALDPRNSQRLENIKETKEPEAEREHHPLRPS